MEVFPNYYEDFSCIADRCKHSCCIGWEIDIDEDTKAFYNSLNTPIGEKIRANIEGEPPHFILKAGDRCPFLNNDGLCDIILTCGKDALCDICTLHPRFKNFYASFEEVGLGLCCEEAVRVILIRDERFEIEIPKCDDEEAEFFKIRQSIFDILQDRKKPMLCRFEDLAREFGLTFDFVIDTLVEEYLELERLDEKWTDELEKLKEKTFDKGIFNKYPIYFEQLAVYFIFRHLSEALYDGDIRGKVNFALMGCFLLGAMWSLNEDKEKMFDLVRMYSSEVEYSEENLEKMRGN
ncbi:MAG: flagellin lysine-N-methylase [Clostridia bacterium]|nr:flagellin lysine-N-methylase [Clostridia bacterium]